MSCKSLAQHSTQNVDYIRWPQVFIRGIWANATTTLAGKVDTFLTHSSGESTSNETSTRFEPTNARDDDGLAVWCGGVLYNRYHYPLGMTGMSKMFPFSGEGSAGDEDVVVLSTDGALQVQVVAEESYGLEGKLGTLGIADFELKSY